MSASLKYLMDENVDIAYCIQMRRRKPDLTIRAIGEPGIPPKKTTDSLSSSEINQKAKQFIVLIDGRDSLKDGSGSIIGRNGNTYQVLTNWHVVAESNDYRDYTITTVDKQTHAVTKITRLDGADLAVITFESKQSYSIAKLGDSERLSEGQPLHYAGYPADKPRPYLFYANQSINGFIPPSDAEDGYSIVFTGAVVSGMSGSPLLDDNGDIIGVYGRAIGDRLYGIPINTAKLLASKAGITIANGTLPTPKPSPISTPTPTPTPSPISTPTPTPSPSATPTPTPSPSATPPNIPQPSPTIGINKGSVIALYNPNYAQDGIIAGRSGSYVVLTPDEKKIITYGAAIRIWDLATGKLERTLTGHSGSVRSVAISPDGQRLVSGSSDDTIKVWNLATGQLERTLTGHSEWVLSVAISPDGKRVVSGGEDKTIKVWNLATGKLERTLTGHSEQVYSVAISPDGRTIVSGGEDTDIRVWRLAL